MGGSAVEAGGTNSTRRNQLISMQPLQRFTERTIGNLIRQEKVRNLNELASGTLTTY